LEGPARGSTGSLGILDTFVTSGANGGIPTE
jgi:hypothetical protein